MKLISRSYEDRNGDGNGHSLPLIRRHNKIRFLAKVFGLGMFIFSLLPALVKAQSLVVYASSLPGDPVVHISIRGTYANNSTWTLGYYDDSEAHPDNDRVDSYGTVLATFPASDGEVADAYDAMIHYGDTYTYNALFANCGSAVDNALTTAGLASFGSRTYQGLAISGTAQKILTGLVGGGTFTSYDTSSWWGNWFWFSNSSNYSVSSSGNVTIGTPIVVPDYEDDNEDGSDDGGERP